MKAYTYIQQAVMLVLSFDIGIKNLAYCYFDYNKTTDVTEIKEWGILDISSPDKSNESILLLDQLNTHFTKLEIDFVVIENQPALKNPVMKTVQVMVFTFFQYQKVLLGAKFNVYIINARSKIKSAQSMMSSYGCDEIVCKTAPSNKYKWNKEASILYTKQFLEFKNLKDNLDFFNQFKKKDDLADTLLQGLYFVRLSTTTEPAKLY